MPLIETITHTFDHAWSDVSLASWKKYPNQQLRPDILGLDVFDKRFDAETGELTARRVVWVKSMVPPSVASFIGIGSVMTLMETSVVNPREQRMTLSSVNISFNSIVEVEETCTYTPKNANATTLMQVAKASAFPYGFRSQIESFIMSRFAANAVKGQNIMEAAIRSVQQHHQRHTATASTATTTTAATAVE